MFDIVVNRYSPYLFNNPLGFFALLVSFDVLFSSSRLFHNLGMFSGLLLLVFHTLAMFSFENLKGLSTKTEQGGNRKWSLDLMF